MESVNVLFSRIFETAPNLILVNKKWIKISLEMFEFLKKELRNLTPVFRYGASPSSKFSRKNFLWNLFMKCCKVFDMKLDLK
jgi:hypothetical protein